MANADAPFGFRPIGADGGPYQGRTVRVQVPTTASEGPLFIGDVVTLIGSGSTDGYPTVKEAAATEAAYGVITAFEADGDDLSTPYRKAATQRYAQVALCEGNIFEAQVNGALGLAGIGTTSIYVVGAGNTTTGLSTTEVSATDAGTSAADEIRVLGFVDAPDNDPTLTNAKIIVKFNEPQTRYGAVGV